jgi:carbamoylphosphate synthase large subunit
MKNKIPDKASVLVTNGWVRTAYNIVESLGRRGIAVHVVDNSKHAMSRYSRWTRSFHLVPNFYKEPKGYVQALADIIRYLDIKVLMPVLEDIITLAEHEDVLPKEVKFVHASLDSLKIANDKFEIIKSCQQVGAPCAETWAPSSFEEVTGLAEKIDYPVVCKTRRSNSGKGVFIVYNKDDLLKKYNELIYKFSLSPEKYPIIQEYLGTHVIGVCMIYDRGRLLAATAEAYLRCKEMNRFGTSVFRVSIQAPAAVKQCRSVADSLGWNGVIQFDLIFDAKTKQYKIIEANPRFWGGLILSIYSGVDYPYMLYKLALNESVFIDENLVKTGVSAHWVLGEIISLINLIKSKSPLGQKLDYLTHILKSSYKGGSDDFRLADPVPFLMELYDYFLKFLHSGSLNPVEDEMIF